MQMVRITVLLMLAILGHGLLMADRTDAAGHGDHSYAVMSRFTATPTAGTPNSDAACFTVLTVIKSSPLQVPASARIAPPPNDEPEGAVPFRAQVASPHHPPDTVRALLQVYRI
jgi:hypothetical protein